MDVSLKEHNQPKDIELLLAQPRGFCAGVKRAIEMVERVLALYGAPVFVRHEIVHNSFVLDDLRSKGAIFVDDLNQVPENSIVIFSAHGVSKAIYQQAINRHLKIFDATCPLVTKVHAEVLKMHAQNIDVIMIGHRGHPEVEGTMGQVSQRIYLVECLEDVQHLSVPCPDQLAFVTQTTLSVDETAEIIAALKEKYPLIREPKKQDICYATQNRQDAVKVLVPQVDVVIVVGSANSSNSNRLLELSKKMNVQAYLVDSPDQIQANWFIEKAKVGLTAGASTPEELVQQIIDRLFLIGVKKTKRLEGVQENVLFHLPKELITV